MSTRPLHEGERRHQRRSGIVLLIVGSAALLWFVGLVIHTFAEARRAAMMSLVLSVHDEIKGLEVITPRGEEWQLLDGAQTRELSAAAEPSSYDAGPSKGTYNGIPVDVWGRHLWIAIRQGENGDTEYLVWSLGPDGESGTDDDLIASGTPERTTHLSGEQPIATAGVEWKDD